MTIPRYRIDLNGYKIPVCADCDADYGVSFGDCRACTPQEYYDLEYKIKRVEDLIYDTIQEYSEIVEEYSGPRTAEDIAKTQLFYNRLRYRLETAFDLGLFEEVLENMRKDYYRNKLS